MASGQANEVVASLCCAWELRAEHEANAAAGEVDLVLEEKLDDANFEAEETSFAQELMTMPAFSADKLAHS